jgi:hypothetical protein
MISLKKLLKESDDFDMTGNAHKRIGPDTKKGFSPTPVFGKKNAQGEPEDDEKSDADKKLDVIPLQEGDTIKISKADRENVQFMSGVKLAVQDKAQDNKRDISQLPPDFQRGYKTVKRTSWWDKANDRLTQWVSSLGSSYGNRR